MNLVATPKQLLSLWSIRVQLIFFGVSAALAAAWAVLQGYPQVAARWASYLGMSADSPAQIAEDLLVASLIVNVITPPISLIARAWKQNLSWQQVQALPPEDTPGDHTAAG